MLGLIATEQTDLDAAQRYLQESLSLALEIGYKRYEANTRTNLARLAGMLGDFSTAQSDYQGLLQIHREIGDRGGEAIDLGNLGWLSGLLRDYPAAYAYSEQKRRIALEMGDRLVEVVALVNLSGFARLQGHYAAAIAHANEGINRARALAIPGWEAWALTVLGHAEFAQSQLVQAMQTYQDALEIRRKLNQLSLAYEPLAGLARTALADRDLSLAETYTRTILSSLENGVTLDGADEPLRIYLTCVQVLAALADPQSDELLNLAYSKLQEQATRILDENSRRSYLENVPWHRELITRWQASSHQTF